MKKFFFILAMFTYLFSFDSYDFENLIGYTIIDVKHINGDFEGCDYGKKIVFMDGTYITCNCYHYHYTYSPKAIILAKSIKYKGQNLFLIKMIVDNYIYNMEAVYK